MKGALFMILVRNESVCRITREQLLEGAKESLSKTLSQMYQAEFLEEVLDEATAKVEIPAIVDSNSIFLLKNNELFEYRFTDSEEYLLLENQYQLSSLSPRYADSESGIKLQFDMSTFLMRNCRWEKKVLIVKTDNTAEISTFETVKEVLKKCLYKYLCEVTANQIVKDFESETFSNAMFIVKDTERNLYYAFEKEKRCREIKTFSVEETAKIIQKHLNKTKTTKKYSKKMAIRFYNLLFSKFDFDGYPLHVDFDENGNRVVKKIIDSVWFYLGAIIQYEDEYFLLWRAVEKVNKNEIVWHRNNPEMKFPLPSEYATYRNFWLAYYEDIHEDQRGLYENLDKSSILPFLDPYREVKPVNLKRPDKFTHTVWEKCGASLPDPNGYYYHELPDEIYIAICYQEEVKRK